MLGGPVPSLGRDFVFPTSSLVLGFLDTQSNLWATDNSFQPFTFLLC